MLLPECSAWPVTRQLQRQKKAVLHSVVKPFPILSRTLSDIMIFLFRSDVRRRPTRFCCARSAVGACPMLFLMQYGLWPTDSAGYTLSVSQQDMCFDVNR